mmetsp:Transcript_1030/g.4363  ORF Transcript_1030/g.4363 Transcript_1030/m.4363 type:complete len:228 (-) Transcript_1030:626-1309(-)
MYYARCARRVSTISRKSAAARVAASDGRSVESVSSPETKPSFDSSTRSVCCVASALISTGDGAKVTSSPRAAARANARRRVFASSASRRSPSATAAAAAAAAAAIGSRSTDVFSVSSEALGAETSSTCESAASPLFDRSSEAPATSLSSACLASALARRSARSAAAARVAALRLSSRANTSDSLASFSACLLFPPRRHASAPSRSIADTALSSRQVRLGSADTSARR